MNLDKTVTIKLKENISSNVGYSFYTKEHKTEVKEYLISISYVSLFFILFGILFKYVGETFAILISLFSFIVFFAIFYVYSKYMIKNDRYYTPKLNSNNLGGELAKQLKGNNEKLTEEDSKIIDNIVTVYSFFELYGDIPYNRKECFDARFVIRTYMNSFSDINGEIDFNDELFLSPFKKHYVEMEMINEILTMVSNSKDIDSHKVLTVDEYEKSISTFYKKLETEFRKTRYLKDELKKQKELKSDERLRVEAIMELQMNINK